MKEQGNRLIIVNIIGVSILLLFFTIVFAHVFSSQLGTADDAAIAVAARNLAEGNGYATSVPFDGSYGLSEFSPGITTGPTMVLPAALMIKLFGNKLWVPGFVTATFCLILLFLIIVFIRKRFNFTIAILFSLVLIFFFYNLTVTSKFVQWYVLLGELPAAFLNILAVILIAAYPNNRKYILVTGLLFGLAFMAKMLSFLGFIPILGLFFYSLIVKQDNRKQAMINYSFMALAFATPYLLFELWKFISFGLTDYLNNWYAFLSLFAHLSGVNEESTTTLLEKFVHRNELFSIGYGFSIYLLLIVSVATSIFVYYFSDKKFVRFLFVFFMLGAYLHLSYWMFFSTGWSRYALIGLILYFAGLSSLVFIKLPKGISPVIIILLVIVFLKPLSELKEPISRLQQSGFSYCLRLENLQKTVSFLEKYKQEEPFVSAWWASVVDIEYAMPDLQNFRRFDHLTKEDYKHDLIIVSNTKFTAPRFNTDKFDHWNKGISKVIFEAPPYIVYKRMPGVITIVDHTTVDFSKTGNSGSFITYGWGRVEDSYRWTNGKTAGLSFTLPSPAKDTLTLKLLGFGYLAKGRIKEQEVAVYVNNRFITKWYVINQNWYKVIIPPDIIIDSTKVVVDLRIDYAASPADFGYSADKRRLGLCVRKIVIE